MAGTEKVGILIELENADEALKTLQRIDNTVRDLGRKKTMIKLDDGSVESIDDRIKKIQDRLTALRAAKKLDLLDEDEVAEMKRLNAELDILKRGLRDGTAQARTFKQVFNGWSSKIAHAGSAMQSFGNALTQLTNPFRQLTNGVLLGAGYKVLNSFTEGLESGFERADVMRKYPRVMQNMGYSADEAQKSIDKLDQSVQGLPTSLVDMVSMSQRFTSTMGDLTDGTDLAIAANNAFLASMSTDTQKYQGMMQLQDVIGGKKMNAREWASLANSMLPAIRMMGEYLGYEGKDLDEYVAKVQQGKIANQEFVDTLIKAGTEEGGKIRTVALESLDTWEAFFSRVGTAASKFTYKGIIEPLNEIVNTVTNGKFASVNLLLDDLIYNGIDKMGQSVKNWIKSHPEEITEFFKTLKQIDVASFLKGFAKGLGDVAKIIGFFANLAGKVGGLGLLGRFMAFGNFFGRALNTFGGLLKGSRHPLAGILTGGTILGSKIGGKLGKVGIFKRIASIFGKSKEIQEAEKTAKTIPTVADTFKGAFSALQGLITAAGAVTIVAGTGFVAFKAAKSILKDLKEMTDLVNGGGWDNVGYVGAGVITAIGTFTEIFNAIGKALGPEGLLSVAIAGAASVLVTGTIWADTKLILESLENVKQTILKFDEIGSAITNMHGLVGINTGKGSKIADSVQAIRDVVDVLVGKNGSPMDRGEVSLGIPTVTSSTATSMTNLVNTITSMQQFAKKLNAITETSISEGAVDKVTEIGNAIRDITKAMPNAMKNGNSSYGHMADNIKTLNTALKSMSKMTSRINNLAGMDVNTSGFSTYLESIRTALDDFKDLSGELMLDIEVKLSPLFGSSVQGVMTNIKNAKRDIEKLKSSVSFTIPVSVTFSVSTNALSAIRKIQEDRARVRHAREGGNQQVYSATGGMIYRSGGGGIPWKRRGTDTVPAMLTPGEYVHNRRAVSTFGIDFMRKVNNLDVKGAMNELMHRAGHMANINRGTSITNNYNNNQKVVINNNGNAGAGYTFKRASRFVGAF